MPDLREQLEKTLTGTYTLERELGGGGMSRVFVADETRLDRKVVVKVLSPELAAGISGERFQREIKVAASLQQANIVPVLSTGETEGLPYYTMPFVEGESLRTRLAKGPFSIAEATKILGDVARALNYAHARGIVHRDIKPDNVLLSGGTAVVTDFGIAKALAASQTGGGATITQLGTALGTPAYMAPEQAAGDPNTDHRADFYAFGCMAYELIAGRPPFDARTPQKLLTAHMSETARPVHELRPDCSGALSDLIARCMAKDAEQRPGSAAELLQVLDASATSSGGGLPVMPSILLGGPGMLRKALGVYAAAFVIVAIVTRAAILAIGLPDWVFPGALIVMALGLPVILFTGYVHHVNRRVATMTPSITPGGTSTTTQSTMANIALKATPHVSWRRTMMGGVYSVGAFMFLVGGFMALRALGIGPAGSLFAAGKIARNQALIVADFGVKGNADTSLGGVVSEALRTDLAQSSVLSVTTPAAVRGALTRMRRPVTSRLDVPLARELAQREGIKAVVDGDVTPLGAGFIVTARLLSSESGDELASFREVADSPRELIPSIEKLSRALRGKIGESLKSVRETPALAQVSTASLEALRKYAEGVRAVDLESDEERGAALLNEAIALDSGFAMAWRKLAIAYGNAGFLARGDSAAAQAYRHRDRLTETERLTVVGVYFSSGLGRDRAKAAEAYEALLNKGVVGANATNLANIYVSRRALARAESVAKLRLAEPGAPYTTHSALVAILFERGKMSEAESLARELPRKFPNVAQSAAPLNNLHYRRGHLDSVLTSYEAMSRTRDAQIRANATGGLSQLQRLRGQLAAAERLRIEQRAIDSARGIPVNPYAPTFDAAVNDIWFRDRADRGVARIDAALARRPLQTVSRELRPYLTIAQLYARGKRPDKARAILAQYDDEVRDTMIRRSQMPDRQEALAEIAFAEGSFSEGIKQLRASWMLPDGPNGPCSICESVELGRAFDLANQPDSALTHFDAFLSGHAWNRWNPDATFLAPVLKRMGELYEAKADRAKAYAMYARFVDLWKNADPELQPKVAEVRRRMARLKDTETR
jgi:tRNA A-37 threonylcarbamoyl transferase component Bud32/tetratricopeptide (TPR) repeat protein